MVTTVFCCRKANLIGLKPGQADLNNTHQCKEIYIYKIHLMITFYVCKCCHEEIVLVNNSLKPSVTGVSVLCFNYLKKCCCSCVSCCCVSSYT